MKLRSLFLAACAVPLALSGPATLARQGSPSPQSAAVTAPAVQAKPALWKISDSDTTIYLFGTIHILPGGVDWLHGPVAYAFDHSDLLVTELPEVPQTEMVQGLLKHGVLPAGQSLRSKMGEERRGRYEAAMKALGQPASLFDRNQPWVPAMLLPLLSLGKHGFDPQYGVEAVLEARGKKLGKPRIGLETLDFQFKLFAGIEEEVQLDYLDTVVKGLPEMDQTIHDLVDAWKRGDAAALAGLFEDDLTEPEMAEALAYSRNRTWSKWIVARMKQPGKVFVAVGAGHLAGKKSVNALLVQDGFRVERVQ